MTRVFQTALLLAALAAVIFTGNYAALALPANLYWDINGNGPGGSDPSGFFDGVWDTSTTNWNSDPSGSVSPGPWVPGSTAIFIAGNDPVADGFVQINGTQNASSIIIEDGVTRFRLGMADTGSGTVTVNPGATLDINSTQRLNTTAGKVVLHGGTLLSTNP